MQQTHLAEVDDKLRFPVMMSDSLMTGWLDCTAWLIEHPEGAILVDTGESAAFGTPAYFGEAAQRMGRTIPRSSMPRRRPEPTFPASWRGPVLRWTALASAS